MLDRVQEGADMQPMVLDDPNTEQPADYWLHPCASRLRRDWAGRLLAEGEQVFSALKPWS